MVQTSHSQHKRKERGKILKHDNRRIRTDFLFLMDRGVLFIYWNFLGDGRQSVTLCLTRPIPGRKHFPQLPTKGGKHIVKLIRRREGVRIMTLPEVGAIQFLQPASAEVHTRKQVTAVRPDEEGDKAKRQRERGVSSPIQDQVTLSKEAQALARSTSQSSKNNSFHQSPSPFDR